MSCYGGHPVRLTRRVFVKADEVYRQHGVIDGVDLARSSRVHIVNVS